MGFFDIHVSEKRTNSNLRKIKEGIDKQGEKISELCKTLKSIEREKLRKSEFITVKADTPEDLSKEMSENDINECLKIFEKDDKWYAICKKPVKKILYLSRNVSPEHESNMEILDYYRKEAIKAKNEGKPLKRTKLDFGFGEVYDIWIVDKDKLKVDR